MRNVRLALTKLCLNLNGARFLRVMMVRLPYDREVEIVVYSSKQDSVLGQTTITGVIAIHEAVLHPSYLLHYILAHEDAHNRQWYSVLSIPITVVFWLCAPTALVYGFITLGIFVVRGEIGYLFMFLQSLLLSFFLGLILCTYSWFIEYKADCEAIRKLGVHTVRDARNHIANLSRPPRLWRIIARMTNPPISFTIHVCRFFNRDLGI